MKFCFTIVLVILSNFAIGQIYFEPESGICKEINQIIINYQSSKAKRLRIVFENSEGELESIRVKFLTDSTFIYGTGRQKMELVTRGDEIFDFGTNKIDDLKNFLPTDQVSKRTEKDGVFTRSLYYVTGTDSILYSTWTQVYDSTDNSTTTITKYRSGKNWTGSKHIKTVLSDDLVRTQNFTLIDNVNWKMSLDKVDITLKSQTKFSKTKILMTKGTSMIEDGNGEYFNLNHERKSILYYDQKRLIEAVVIVNTNHEDGFESSKIKYLTVYSYF
ncbi:MAG: hypothetical protein HRT57_17080 [Crocinitomicaceae bacterium]|nr:hypothetical protein [Crocinitomicaceae bacterium]